LLNLVWQVFVITSTGGFEMGENSWSGFPTGAFLAVTPVAAIVKKYLSVSNPLLSVLAG